MTKKIEKLDPLVLPLPIPVIQNDPDPATLAEPVIYVKGSTGQLRYWDLKFGTIGIVWDVDVDTSKKQK